MKPRFFVTLGVALVLLWPVAALGQNGDFYQTFSGANNGGPTFNRPTESCAATGTSVRYQAQTFYLASASNCYIVSGQVYDGYIHLYQGGFNPANPTANCIEGDDDGELGVGTSRFPHDLSLPYRNLPAGLYTLVTSAFSGTSGLNSVGSFENTIHCESAQPVQGSCFFIATPRDQQTCHVDRFAVRITGISNHPTDGVGTPVRFGSSDSAIFWFYNDRNFEVMLKVLNGCAINGNYWVFIGALTNQAYSVQVGDAISQQVNTYSNTLGTRAAAVADTHAFPCNP
jgi:hypothetical protein